MDNFMSVLSFIKSFKGPATIDGKTIEAIFYNEREWRYVPTKEEIREIHGSVQVWGPEYLIRKQLYNDWIARLRLKIEIDDITHIILNHGSEVSPVIEAIRSFLRELHPRK